MKKNSQKYYDMIGIDAELSQKEKDIIAIIEEKQTDTMPETIAKLLDLSRKKNSRRGLTLAI